MNSESYSIMNTQRLCFRTLALVLLSAFLAGCSVLAPRTAALQSVHTIYRGDFAGWVAPAPGGTAIASNAQPPFAATLQSIRDFRVKYGTDSAENAHLTVLEGMVYLQTGRIGMAKLLAPDIRQQMPRLVSGTGHDVRDMLFAASFDDLVAGWGEINAKFDNNPATFTHWQVLRDAAAAIDRRLQDSLTAKRFAAPEADEGGIYLATTAGIFYDWAYATEKIENPDAAAADRTNWFRESHDLIGRFLSDTEKTAAANATNINAAMPGRVRYLEWYSWLGR
jgi:hypothetical protein